MVNNSLKFTGKDPSIKGFDKEKLLEQIVPRRLFLKQDFSGLVPNVLIGSYGYPDVSAGFLCSDDSESDKPLDWSAQGKDILSIIRLRQNMVNSKFNVNVNMKLFGDVSRTNSSSNFSDKTIVSSGDKPVLGSFGSRFSDSLKDAGLSRDAVSADVSLNDLSQGLRFNKDLLPYGPSGTLKDFRVTSNPKVPRLVDKFESDIDVKAGSALIGLSSKGLDEHYLTRIFSTGNLGLKVQRKIVPTRWSITAVDDSLGKDLIGKIRNFNDFHDASFFYGGYLGNYFVALVFPGPWSFELFETYVGSPGNNNPNFFESSHDFESFNGRKEYAFETTGGYYASRLACLEYLISKGLSGRVLLLRFITDEYVAPLGVWVVREASRKVFNNVDSKSFDSLDSLLKFSLVFCLKNFNVNVNVLYRKSFIVKNLNQRTLNGFS